MAKSILICRRCSIYANDDQGHSHKKRVCILQEKQENGAKAVEKYNETKTGS